MVDNIPPGWYDQPNDPANKRWWDGQNWTEHTAPVVAESAQSAQPAQAATAQYASAPTQNSPWAPNGATPKKSKTPLIIGLAVGALALIVVIILLIALVLGSLRPTSIDSPPDEPSSSQSDDQPSDDESDVPSDEPSEEPSEDLTTIEQAYVDLVNSYLVEMELPELSDQEALDFGYEACSQVDSGMDEDGFYDFIMEEADDDMELAGVYAYMFGAGISALCPENTSVITNWFT